MVVGRKAVVKSPIAATHQHETIHESAVMKVFGREAANGALGHEHVPSLLHSTGTKINMSLPLDMSQTPMGVSYRRAQQSRCMMAMSYAGIEMAKWELDQVVPVDGLCAEWVGK